MLALGLAALQLMLDRGAHEDWFNSVEIWIECGVAIAYLWMFAVHLMTARGDTLVNRKLPADRTLVTAMGFMVVIGAVMLPSMALLPAMLPELFVWPVVGTRRKL